MRVSLAWLRDYAALDTSLEGIRRALVDVGIEVDAAAYVAAGTVVARVESLSAVPEPTRKPLTLVELDAGTAEPVRLVTAATNLGVGDRVPWAPPGTLLPGADEALGVRVMLGRYPSPGMLLSDEELGLGEAADGIRVLDHGAPGQPIEQVLQLDAVLEVEVTTNRPDCLCHLGLAREVAAALREPLREPPLHVEEALVSAAALDGRVTVSVEDPEGCRRFCAACVENVAPGAAPHWMRERLRSVGVRPISALVDVSNFVALELGQPLHAFDLDKLRLEAGCAAGESLTVIVRRARAGERLRCLDGVERALDTADLVVCAGERVVSLAGVMGGESTAVDAGTRHVLIEAATWHGAAIRATARRHGLRTEASTRFEKQLSDALPPRALERAAALSAELAGGHVLRGRIDEHPSPMPPPPRIRIDVGELGDILGCPVDASEAATALVRLGFGVEQEGGTLTVLPPDVRLDVRAPVDIVEEVGRSLGYDRIPATLPGRRAEVGRPVPPPPLEDTVRDVVAGAGYDEAITWAFTSAALQERLAAASAGPAPIVLRNPLSEDWAVLRTSLLPGLLQALALNANRGVDDPALFELGPVYLEGERRGPVPGSTPDGLDGGLPPLPAEPLRLALVSHLGDGSASHAAAMLAHARAVLAWLGHDHGGVEVSATPATLGGLRAGRAAHVVVGDRRAGVVGELDDDTIERFGLRGRVVVAEVDVEVLLPAGLRTPRFAAPPRLPAVDRDVAVVVDDSVSAARLLAMVRTAAGELLESVAVVDEFRGAALGGGRRSLTLRLVLRAADRTLTGAEATAVVDTVTAALAAGLGAEVRR